VAVSAQQLGLLVEPGLLVRLERDGQLARLLEVAVDAVAPQVVLEALVVLDGEPLERVELVGEAGRAVADAVGEGGDGEAAVAPAGAEAGALGLEQDDVAAGVVGLRVQRGPQAGEAAADDAEVGVRAAVERRQRLDRPFAVEPERPRLGLRVRGAVGGGRRCRGPGERDGA
jgi:hypothetical protein